MLIVSPLWDKALNLWYLIYKHPVGAEPFKLPMQAIYF